MNGGPAVVARGKHGHAAAVRHEVQARDTEIARYQHMLARVTSERDEARRLVTQQRRASAKTVRELKAQLAAGTSSELDTLRSALQEARDKAATEEENRKRILRQSGEDMALFANAFLDEGVSGKVVDKIFARWYAWCMKKNPTMADVIIDVKRQMATKAKGRHNRRPPW